MHAVGVMAACTDGGGSGSVINYTDGSVDPAQGTTGAAAVISGEVLSWRTLNHCPTQEMELVANQHALEHA